MGSVQERLAWNEASPVPHEAARWLPEAADLLQIICGRLLRAAVRAGDQRSDQQHVSDDQQLLKQPSLVASPPPALLSKLPVLRKHVKPNLQVSPLKVRIELLCKQSFEAQNKRQS